MAEAKNTKDESPSKPLQVEPLAAPCSVVSGDAHKDNEEYVQIDESAAEYAVEETNRKEPQA